MVNLLLHSLGEFRELLFECLNVVRPSTVVEVGAEEGTFTRELAEWATKSDATVVAIDPAPAPGFLEEAAAHSDVLRVVQKRSVEVLADLRSAETFFLDGDHNYATVLAELEAIYGNRDEPSLVVLHDVGWPSGRRDQYYDPDALPPESLHEHSYDNGVVLDNPGVVPGGFRGEGAFAFAKVEGGARHGVLTAVEDFLEGKQGFAFVKVPCIFGLGFVWPTDAPWAADLARLLAPYDGNPLLERLERNRLDLYLHVLEMQDSAAEFHKRELVYLEERASRAAVAADASHRVRDLEAENRALWRRVHELEGGVSGPDGKRESDARVLALTELVDEVVRSRAFKLAEHLSKLRSAVSDTPGISSERIRRALDDLTSGQ